MRTASTAALLVVSLLSQAQNLVPNASFEEHTACPWNVSFSQIDLATGWMPFRVTPDYFHECSLSDSLGVPLNLFGYQEAATGEAYAGITCFALAEKPPFSILVREFLGIQLTHPLTPGVPVRLSFKTVFASSGPPHLYRPQFNCTGIGLRFTMAPFYEGATGAPVPNNAAIYLDHLITDSVNWTLVEGTYVPDSAYAYLVIGNFFDDTSILVNQFDPEGNFSYAYFYVDDVCVTENSSGCEFVGVQEQLMPVAHLWPNPFNDSFRVRGIPPSQYPITVRISDVSGRAIHESGLGLEEEVISPGMHLSNGSYIITISTSQYRLAPVLAVHQSP